MNHQLETIFSHFPDLSVRQKEAISGLDELYAFWNERINLISRKDMENFYLHHVLHSMSVAWYADFKSGEIVLDVGTGGGFPGIPLAILHPEVEFILIDGTLKKLNVVDDVCKQLGLHNVTTIHSRIEDQKIRHHAIVSRAVTDLRTFLTWVNPSMEISKPEQRGIYYLKGGDCKEEARATGLPFKVFDLFENLPYTYFQGKRLVFISLDSSVSSVSSDSSDSSDSLNPATKSRNHKRAQKGV